MKTISKSILWTAFAALILAGAGCDSGSSSGGTTTAGGTTSGTGGTSGGTTGAPGGGSNGGSVNAAGSTFIQPFLSKAFSEYNTKNGFQINYTGGGSGAGIKAVSDGTNPFGASDAPMSDDEEKASKVGNILNLPLILGPIAIVYNVPGIDAGLNLDGDTLAGIFEGKITKWNDPKIAALNSGKKLPEMAISVQVRADGSGSTYVLSDYLSTVNADWKSSMGKNKKLKWNDKAQQWKGSDGVSSNTKKTPGSISYVELSWAKKIGLNTANIKNAAGNFVGPDPKNVTEAASNAKLPDDFRGSIVNAPGANSYPLSTYSYGLVPEDLTKVDKGADVVKTLQYVLTDAQAFAEGLDYAKLPDTVVAQVQDKLKTVKTK